MATVTVKTEPTARRTPGVLRQPDYAVTIKRPGKQVKKEHASWELILSMLIGMRNMLRNTGDEDSELTESDFKAFFKLDFPPEGTSVTPPHSGRDFKFKDYAPKAFNRLRGKFGIDKGDYLVSLTAEYDVCELGTPGKSGSVFYFTRDGRFVIKTMSAEECVLLRQVLPDYYAHVMQYPHTLLTRFFGLHRVKTRRHGKIHFVVMGNIFATDNTIHERYDLKGSTQGRAASEKELQSSSPTLKDLDFTAKNRKLYFGPLKDAFLHQLEKDSALLAKLNIMDYSLLVGVHKTDKDVTPWHRVNPDRVPILAEPVADPKSPTVVVATPSSATASESTAPAASRASAVAASAASPEGGDAAPSGPQRVLIASSADGDDDDVPRVSLAPSTPPPELLSSRKRQISIFQQTEGGIQDPGSREVYYIAIIDILQPYNLRKKLETKFKSLRYNRDEISSVEPPFYAERFMKFMRIIAE
eukprot:TRINITY_DN1054_c0_g1_i1.p2 TRINITY_DN1054_c0_g1~~TRINITY_DN1054_c0_g1_i1.p2  ORF type:complete len:480 (-),score=100.77 TRINITY_DN1054_c0_g1_i1:3343-4755(-)